MPKKPFKAVIADLPREGTRDGTSGSAVITDGGIFVWHWVKPGTVHGMHQHPEDQLAIIVEGEMELEVEGEGTHTLRPGEMYYIPSDVPHAAIVSDDGVVVLNVYSPVSKDFEHLAAHQPGVAAAGKAA